MSAVRQCRVGLLGCGNVGQGLVELVERNRKLIRERSGLELSFTRILVRDISKERPYVDPGLLTTQPEKVINNGCDMVVELVGGLEPARSFIQNALHSRKHVVTANKALLASDGLGFLAAAASQGVQFGFEASVCAGIPIVRALQSGLVGNAIQSVTGILNGTCNYILSRMTEDGLEFDDALRQAQAKGFAEADPTLDVDGHDAAQKLKILSELAFGGTLTMDAVSVQGIREVTAEDTSAARKSGFAIKHLAKARVDGDGALSLKVEPVLLPRAHQLASVRDENNAVLVKGDAVGEMLFHGKGAGPLPSASAVLSDIVEIATNKRSLRRLSNRPLPTAPKQNSSGRYLRFGVKETSSIAAITSALNRNDIAVERAAATWARREGAPHSVFVFTRPCSGEKIEAAINDIRELGVLNGNTLALPLAE